MLTKLVRIGRDSTLRYTSGGTAVTSIACVYDVGFGDKKRAQWLDASLWGKQAEALTQYLTKGKQIVIYADDVEIENYESNGKSGSKLKCRVVNIDLTDNKTDPSPQSAQQSQPQQQPPSKPVDNGDFNNSFDEDIPFAPLGLSNKNLLYCI